MRTGRAPPPRSSDFGGAAPPCCGRWCRRHKLCICPSSSRAPHGAARRSRTQPRPYARPSERAWRSCSLACGRSPVWPPSLLVRCHPRLTRPLLQVLEPRPFRGELPELLNSEGAIRVAEAFLVFRSCCSSISHARARTAASLSQLLPVAGGC